MTPVTRVPREIVDHLPFYTTPTIQAEGKEAIGNSRVFRLPPIRGRTSAQDYETLIADDAAAVFASVVRGGRHERSCEAWPRLFVDGCSLR